MRVSLEDRTTLFNSARKISTALGTPFQNPVPLTAQDIRNELELVRSFEDIISVYKDALLDLESKF